MMAHLYFQLAPEFLQQHCYCTLLSAGIRVSQVLSSSSGDMYKDAAVGGNWGSTSGTTGIPCPAADVWKWFGNVWNSKRISKY